MQRIDLHTHSTASDGTDSPEELVRNAKQADLKAIALTDHDTIAGVEEALAAGAECGLEVIPGCEISTASEFGSHHILGLWAPRDNDELNTFLEQARTRRESRNLAMLEKLKNLGVKISPEDFGSRPMENIGRPHFAALLQKKGYVKDKAEAFREYLASGAKAYVPKSSPPPEAAIELLSRVGATTVWAHPLLQKLSPEILEKLLTRFSEAGLTALEAWHSAHTDEDCRMLEKLAKKYGLALTGGSDYHGKAKPDIKLGSGYGKLQIPYAVLENLKVARKNRGMPC